ncbi:MAG: hypothetical protein ACYC9J_11620 [Sulfuricaulis sp.]
MSKEDDANVVWPIPVRVMDMQPPMQESMAIKELSPESKKELWDYLRIEDPFFASFLMQIKDCEARQVEAGIPEDKILRFDIRLCLCGQAAGLQKRIIKREKAIHSTDRAA